MNIESMREMAKKVEIEHETLERVKDDRDMAEEELLAQVVDTLRPALPAMCSKVLSPGSEHLQFTQAVFIGELPSHAKLYIEHDATWFSLTPAGFVRTNYSEGEILDCFEIGDIVSKLAAALHAQVGARESSIDRINDEAVRFRALVTLLKPPPPKQRHPKSAR